MSESDATRRRSYGTGSLYVRADRNGSETWYGRWYCGGRRVKRKIGPKRTNGSREGLTRSQAERELRRLIGEARIRPLVGERVTVGEVGDRYRRAMADHGRKESSIRSVEQTTRVWLAPFFGDRSLDSIRPEDVSDLMALMRRRGLAPKSIRNYTITLSTLFNFACRKGLAIGNPVKSVDLPEPVPNDDIRFLASAEVHALAAAAVEGPYQVIDRALFTTAAMTGLRLGELRALRWRDVDWQAGQVRVRRSYVRGEFTTRKSRHGRAVPLADDVARAIDTLAAGEPDNDALVFADPATGEPLSDRALLRRYSRALAAAGLDTTLRFHDLRHTFGTRMAAANVPMRTLQAWMGHAALSTTEIYAHYTPRPDERAMVERAFAAHQARGPIRGPILRQPDVTSDDLSRVAMPDLT